VDKQCLLIGDIGGTNARFALADADTPAFSRELTLSCTDFETAEEAMASYLEQVGAQPPSAICLAVAGAVVGGRVRFTNNHWRLDRSELVARFSTDKVTLLNDFEAIAYSVPFLKDDDCVTAGLLPMHDLNRGDFTVGIIGPGTGLGAAALLCRGGRLMPIAGEGGHLGFAPETQLQMDVLLQLREQFDRVSDERLVSGPGLENVYTALRKLHGDQPVRLSAARIFECAATNCDARATEALQLFFEVLGQVAGNLALTLLATDGIFIAGGIVKRKPDLLANSRFRAGFEGKGRYRSLMEQIPTQIIMHPQPGLLGAAYCAAELHRNAAD
jgi:glucokinase